MFYLKCFCMSQLTDDLLSRIDIVDVIGKYVPLKRSGSNFSGNCPFHNEKTPSFMVSPQKQIFKCFWCWKWGNALMFVQEIERLDFRDAVKTLAKDINFDLSSYDQKHIQEHTDQKEKIKKIHVRAQSFFVEQLSQSTKALAYLQEKRHLTPEILQSFGIGFATEQHYGLITSLKKRWCSDQDIIDASLAKRGTGWDIYSFFRNRITFPIFDTMGNIVAFWARAIDPNDTPKYLNSSDHVAYDKSKTLYGLHRAKQSLNLFNYIIVVEGYMDVIALERLGFPVAVASCWTSLTEEHMKLLKRYTDTVYFLFDNDGAGHAATLRALKLAYKYTLFPKVITLPKTIKDIDDVANTLDGKETFQTYIKDAQDWFITVFERLRSSSDFSSPIDKQKVFASLFNLLLGLENPSIQMHYLSLLSEKVWIAYEVLYAQYKKYVATEGKFYMQQQQRTQKETKPYQPDREMLFVSLFINDFLRTYVQSEPLWIWFFAFIALLRELGKDVPFVRLLDKYTEEEKKTLDEAQLWWEYHLQEVNDEEKKLAFIKQVVWPLIQTYSMQLLKQPGLTDEQKQQLLSVKKGI